MPKGVKNTLRPDKEGETDQSGTDSGESKMLRTRSRSRTRTTRVTVAHGEVSKVTKSTVGQTKMGKKNVVKRLQFEGEMSSNNNATVSTPAKRAKTKCSKGKSLAGPHKTKVAKSNSGVIDKHAEALVAQDDTEDGNNFDNVLIDVDAHDSEFASESEYEMEADNDTEENGSRNGPHTQASGEVFDRNAVDISSEHGLHQYFNKMMDEKLADTRKELADVRHQLAEEKQRNAHKGSELQFLSPQINSNRVKSPSDTTIYVPALNKRSNNGGPNNVNTTNIADNIANFVEGICLADEQRGSPVSPLMRGNGERRLSQEEQLRLDEARKKAERSIVQAETYKELITEPPGEHRNLLFDKEGLMNQVRGAVGDPAVGQGQCNVNLAPPIIGDTGGLTDDNFFHLMCHVEQSFISKIEKGEFIELEKLLPKERKKRGMSDNRLEWIQSEGGTFLAPVADRLNKISNFRRWEQAFRVYATIYCGANPNRSREIWQYVSVINTAASSFIWDNVYEYDVIFRHLMAFNPARSWAVTYGQMWNICMKDPLPQRFGQNSRGGNSFFRNGNNSHSNAGGTKKKKKPCAG